MGSFCSGINDNGQIVGQYTDAAGVTHGYILSGGRFTAINYPKAIFAAPLKINLAAQILGQYKTSDGRMHGFLLTRSGCRRGRCWTSGPFTGREHHQWTYSRPTPRTLSIRIRYSRIFSAVLLA